MKKFEANEKSVSLIVMAVIFALAWFLAGIPIPKNEDFSGFDCPDKFTTLENYTSDIVQWTQKYVQKYPKVTTEDLFSAREIFLKKNKCDKVVLENEEDEYADMPTIKMSELPDPNGSYDEKYSNKYSFIHGGIMDKDGKYKIVVVEDPPIEEPISMSYSNEHHLLNLKSDIQINETLNQWGANDIETQRWAKETTDNLILQYGDIARQYSPNKIITNYYDADVDNDGIKEKIVTLCGFGANHCSDYSEIIKGNEVVFSTQTFYANGRGIVPNENGFDVHWTDEGSFLTDNGEPVGLCCELSHHKTQFVFDKKSKEFMPVKQWKIPHVWKKVIEG